MIINEKKSLDKHSIRILDDEEIFNKIKPGEVKLHEKNLKKNGFTILENYVKENALNMFKNKIQVLLNFLVGLKKHH